VTGGSLREELKIKGEEICLGEELGRKNFKNKHTRIFLLNKGEVSRISLALQSV